MDRPLHRQSATQLAATLRAGDRTAREVTDTHLDRIENRDEAINAFVTVTDDVAREMAAAADESREAGEPLGPLHGVPIALKDLYATKAGIRHTYGSAPLADNVADETAAVVERLENAGAVVVGKTNTPEFGHKGTTDNLVIGPTASPVDTSLNAGGSSGGSAAAVSAGMVPIATGSDAGGSLRIPAAMCGVVGFKPSFGVVPDDTRPTAFGRKVHHNTLGPLARTVEDAALMLDVMAGDHPRDPSSAPVSLSAREAVDRSIEDWTVAYSPDLGVFPVTDAVESVTADAAGALENAGASVETVEFDPGATMGELAATVTTTFTTSLLGMAEVVAEETGVDLRDPDEEVSESLQLMLSVGESFDVEDVARTGIRRTTLFDAVQDQLETHDVMVTPTIAEADIGLEEEIGERGFDLPLTWPFNLTGHPVASVPAGTTADGHPVGLQIVGQPHADEAVLSVAAALERVRPWDYLYK